MKRTLLAVLSCATLLAAMPALASAHGVGGDHGSRSATRHHRRHHGRRHHHRSPGTTGSAGTAGTVTSFTGGVLTITLTNGTAVAGQVTDETEIRCPAVAHSASRPDNDGDRGATACQTALQTTGTPVVAADIAFTSAGAVWRHIELGS
jgi:hypothetical protein